MEFGSSGFWDLILPTTPDHLQRRMLFRFHAAQNAASRKSKPIAGPVSKKRVVAG
jgi:hypothetical protein